jgi:hypothetical protein
MIRKWLVNVSHNVIEALSQNLLGGSEENNEKPDKVGLQYEIWIQDTMNTPQECYFILIDWNLLCHVGNTINSQLSSIQASGILIQLPKTLKIYLRFF